MANWHMYTDEGNEAVESMVNRLSSIFTPDKSFAELREWVRAEVDGVAQRFPEVHDTEPRVEIQDKMDEFFLSSIGHPHLDAHFEWL